MFPALKWIPELVIGIGVGTIVENAIKATTPANTTFAKKVAITVGGVAISGLVASSATTRIVDQITETTAQIKEATAALRKKKA